MLLFIICFLFLCILSVFLLARKFRNPYKLIMIFGKKGCGKSTTLTKLALQHQARGWNVYSTEHIPGCYFITPEQIGFTEMLPHSVLLCDEVGMLWDNRNYRSFKPEVRDWFKLQRHRHVKVYLFSQTFDIDKKLRDLTDEMYLLTNIFGVWTYGKRINKKIVLNDSTADAPSSIAENLAFDSILFFWMGSRTLTFIPFWARFFDSFEAPALEEVDYPHDMPINLKKEMQWLTKLNVLIRLFKK